MPSLQDSALIFIIALLLFGPKKLPVLARELGKWIGEFRRASNEFKMQMEEELRISEQTERQEKLAAIEAAAPPAPALEGVPTEEPEHPHLPRPDALDSALEAPETLPIAVSGDLSI
ncbi:MAG: twin-arginine translocase TatA/TatE family subunit, partial [Acidobacteriaceae bacterium]